MSADVHSLSIHYLFIIPLPRELVQDCATMEGSTAQCTHTRTYTHTYTHTYIPTYTHTHTHTHITHTHTHTHIHTYTHTPQACQASLIRSVTHSF